MNLQNKNILLHLSLIPGVGPSTALKIIKHVFHEAYPDLINIDLMDLAAMHGDVGLFVLYDFSVLDFVKKLKFTEKFARQVVTGLENKQLLEDELALIEQYSIDVLSLFEPEYPEILKQIHLPPLILYCKGAPISSPEKRISIVGSRKASDYAHQVVNTLVPQLVARDWNIVSGGAEGVDSMAHQATIDAGGKTIVVLGSGLMHPYPDSNKELFKTVVRQGGTLVSSFPLNTRPDRSNFPARNRIIAGLSHGCVIVQAAEKSGALITAQFALEQGRHVFAVPGSIYEPLSVGCHALIQQGAKLINSTRDILEDFGETEKIDSYVPAITPADEKKQPLLTEQAPTIQRHDDPMLQLLVMPCTLDELSDHTGLSLPELQNKLFELQLEGKVRQTFSGAWELCE